KKDQTEASGSSGGGKKNPPAMPPNIENAFFLEEVFPSTETIFSLGVVRGEDKEKSIVVIDTNAMLLPYQTGTYTLSSLTNIYRKLSSEDRLILPARVAREF
ncbi:hypothetical protein, partial [Roseomonas mucosa]